VETDRAGVVLSRLTMDRVAKIFGVHDRRRYVTAIYDMSLEVGEGEFVCVLGASGCGKTTLLNIAAGFVRPTMGAVYLDGKLVLAPGPERGIVFQEHALFPWMSVFDNVAFGRSLRGEGRRAVAAAVERHLKMVGLWAYRDAWPKDLSGGMKQRVAIARALCSEPKVLLMDEPFASLDAQTRKEMQVQLEAIWQETRKSVMFITHSIDETLLLADRVALMGGTPGHLIRMFDVGLERPRDETSTEFVRLKHEVIVSLRASMSQAVPGRWAHPIGT